MRQLKCLLLEDERLASEVIEDYIREIHDLKLVMVCRTAMQASDYLRENHVDVLFVDIHLPKMSGLDFVRTLKGRYKVIFITAYHEYAIEGFNVSAVDYLLKPVDFSRFYEAVNKLRDPGLLTESSKTEIASPERRSYFFNVDKRQVRVFEDEIIYIESLKEYIRIHTENAKIVTRFQISAIEQLFQGGFLRVHKSFVVNMKRVTAFSSSKIELASISLPVGRSYKQRLEQEFHKVSDK